MRKIFISIFLTGCISGLYAQSSDNETAISMQVRPRAEYRNGVLSPRSEGDLASGFITNRARLSLDYKRSDLSMKMAAQHVGVWGEDPQIDRNGNFILNEAWAKIYLHKFFYAQLGRQALSYDDERILGALDWNVAGRYHDALKLGYENDANKLHLILAYNQNSERTIGGTYYALGGQPYKTMQTLWYNYAEPNFSLSALFINLGQEAGEAGKTDPKYLQTFGINMDYSYEAFKLYGSVYLQSGKTIADNSVSAWMAALKASYLIGGKINLIAGTDFLSGNKTGDDKHKAFNPLYGTHHKFYGAMDYFYATNFIRGLNPGLWDKYLGVNFTASKTMALSATYHHFGITSDIESAGAKVKKGLGSEFDLQFDWTIKKDVKMMAGYSMMFGSESMDIVKGGDHKSWQDWGWVSINVNPRIFFAKW